MTRFDKDKYLRKIKLKRYTKYFYLGIVCLFCIIIGLYFAYSKFSVSKDTEVVKTTVGDFLYGDIVVGAYINGEYSSTFPKKDDGYKFEKIICDNNSTGTWNNDSWGIVVSNLTERTKCNVYFLTNLTVNFDYTGKEETFTVPITGTYKLETWGAQGGGYENLRGGYGAYSVGTIFLSKGQILYVNVGENPSNYANNTSVNGGYNGGGSAITEAVADFAGGGGGATHIAMKSGILSSLSTSLNDILIVSSGGGGGYYHPHFNSIGGDGGGITGNLAPDGVCLENRTVTEGAKATQTTGGIGRGCGFTITTTASFGQGQILNFWSSGGGGGYYGGGVGYAHGASGGSSYIGNSMLKNKAMYCYNCEESNEESTKTVSNTCTNSTPTENCSKQGNGYARITLVSSD